MRKRVLTGALAAAVAGTVLVPAGAAFAASAVQSAHGLQVSDLTAQPATVTLPRTGTATVELRARVHSGADLSRIVVKGQDFAPVAMVKLERSAGPNGTYSALVKIPANARAGAWRYSVEATSAGHTEGADGSFSVKRPAVATPRVVSIDAPSRVTVGKHGAKVRLETVVTNGPAKVKVVYGGESVTLKRVSGDLYRGDLWLESGIRPGKLRYEVRAYAADGSVKSAKSGSIAVRKATVISFDASRKGSSVVLKGKLKGYKEYGYAGIKGAKLHVLYKQSGTGSYEWVKAVTTKRGGAFELRVPYRTSGKWKVVFEGNGGYAPKTSRTDRVR